MGYSTISVVALFTFMLQNSVAMILTRYSRVGIDAADNYHSSSAVLHQELLKLIVCLGIFAYEHYAASAAAHTAEAAAASTTANGSEESGAEARKEVETIEKSEDMTSAAPVAVPVGPAAVKRHTALRRAAKPARLLKFFLAEYPREVVCRVCCRDTLKLLIPASLYIFQNVGLYYTLYHLDVMEFQIWSQSRVLLTALLAVVILRRHLCLAQWGILVALTVGVSIAQLGAESVSIERVASAAGPLSAAGAAATTTTTTTRPPTRHGIDDRNRLFGLLMCLATCTASSAANVYLELMLKDVRVSLALRNIQLAAVSLPLLFFYMIATVALPSWRRQTELQGLCLRYFQPHYSIFTPAPPLTPLAKASMPPECSTRPFYLYQRFSSPSVLGVILMHGLGGLLVAVVMKYADNVLKNFAMCLSVLVSTVLTAVIWHTVPTPTFAVGAVVVLAASYLFPKYEQKK